jgi:hypothetical protein
MDGIPTARTATRSTPPQSADNKEIYCDSDPRNYKISVHHEITKLTNAIRRARRQNRFFVAVSVPSVAEGGEVLSVVAGASDEEIFDRISAAAALNHRGVGGSGPPARRIRCRG